MGLVAIDDLVQRTRAPGRATIVTVAYRDRALRFVGILEHTSFPPGTPANDEIDLPATEWEGLPWVAAILPIAKLPAAHFAAAELGLRLVRAVPFVLRIGIGVALGAVSSPRKVPPDARFFPANHDRIYALEGDPHSRLAPPEGLSLSEDVFNAEHAWLVDWLAAWRARQPQ